MAEKKPTSEEILAAARAQVPGYGADPAAPPIPSKPPPARESAKPQGKPRRNFLVSLVATPFAAAWTLFAVTTAAFTAATARFMMPNVLVEPPSKFKIGPASDYPYGTVSTKWKSQHGLKHGSQSHLSHQRIPPPRFRNHQGRSESLGVDRKPVVVPPGSSGVLNGSWYSS